MSKYHKKKSIPLIVKRSPNRTPQIYRDEVTRDPTAEIISSFIEKPHQVIAEAVTGGIIAGKSELLASAGRILQGVAKRQFKLQLSKEFSDLIEKGRIKKDFGEKIYGFQTLTELLEMIDSGQLKEKEKFEALKKLFFILSTTESTGEEAVVYRLFKIAQNLSASELALLNACYKSAPNNQVKNTIAYTDWRLEVLHHLGHDVADFVDTDEIHLVELKLLTGREHSDGSGVNQKYWRLSDSGKKLCELLEADLA